MDAMWRGNVAATLEPGWTDRFALSQLPDPLHRRIRSGIGFLFSIIERPLLLSSKTAQPA